MDISYTLQAALNDIATRLSAVKPSCANEESTKQFLVLPVLGALGYNYMDPCVVQPEYVADFREQSLDRVDYVVFRDSQPVIAVECKRLGTDLEQHRGQLRAYYSALRTVRMGILTDGVKFEFFVDSQEPNIMDEEPFLTLDLDALGLLSKEVLSALTLTSFSNFQPDLIAELAEAKLISRRLRTILVQEVREPSEEFCRFVLQRIGLKNLRRLSIQTRYGGLVRTAFEEALILPVLDQLRAPGQTPEEPIMGSTSGIVTTERELAIYKYIKRRLAYLAKDERHFAAIERVGYKDYLGKFAIYYENIRKGRMLDFIEGPNGYDRFVFPEPFAEVITNAVSDIDEPLRKIFEARVSESGSPAIAASVRTAQYAGGPVFSAT